MLSQKVNVKTMIAFAFITVLLSFDVAVQELQKIKVNATTQETSSTVRKKAYRFPAFMNGKVVFRDGTSAFGQFNYNVFSGQVEFIDSRDTLALDELHLVKSISMGEELFFYNERGKSLLRLLEEYESTKLLVEEKYELSNIKSKGALGLEKSSLAPNSSGQYYDNGTLENLNTNETLEFAVKSSYYFTDHNNRFVSARKGKILRLYSDHRAEIKEYIKNDKLKLRKERDLKLLLQYCDSL